MNSLSWFLYFAGVVPNLGAFFFMSGLGLLFLGATVGSFLWIEENIKWPALTILPLGLVLMLCSALIPDRETIYAIGASQIGEYVLQLEEVQKVGGEVGGLASDTIELLRQNIQEQLTESPAEGS